MKILKRIVIIMLALFILGIAAFGSVLLFLCYQEDHIPPATGYDAIIVLGAQVLPNGAASVQLGYRLDAALVAYLEAPCPIVTCGAKGSDEPIAEADFMRAWLIEKGVPEESVFSENTSFNTRENIENAIETLKQHQADKVLIVTSDYHLPRAMAIARDRGMDVTGIGSLCKNDIRNWGRNHLRETLAWIKYWLEKYTGLRID